MMMGGTIALTINDVNDIIPSMDYEENTENMNSSFEIIRGSPFKWLLMSKLSIINLKDYGGDNRSL